VTLTSFGIIEIKFETIKYLNPKNNWMFMIVDPEVFLRLVVAAMAGGLVGFERKTVHKPAGIRTHMLVSMGAGLFVIVTLILIPTEAGRIISGIATGVGFLGAGTIFRSKDTVRGLTTAASIWAVAAIGLTAGLGEYVLMTVATVLVILILQLKKLDFLK
jgi:putative Mg2+ transporter-C (MgtC) family protein